MLGQAGADAEGLRRIQILRASRIIPGLWLQRIDEKLPAHQVNKAAAQVICQVLIFHFWIQSHDPHAGFPQVGEQKL